ncbi:MAG: tRNA lysidine(34) synthetase TilS [Rickettsiaceae bacterium H1]|nr:tRNA lysidine(34) synthetase TilS [Rickettsiaceae bacterium H1]
MCIEQKFSSVMHKLEISGKFALAVSGGVDSTALLLLVYFWMHKNKFDSVKCNPVVLTVNHNLRPEAKLECQHVLGLARSLNLECRILTWDNSVPKQNKARDARYRLLTDWCKKNQVKELLLAHHSNDQAETVLIRISRGSGLDGLCAMQEVGYKNGIKLMRPLLSFTKKQLAGYVTLHNLKWVEDPSNDDKKYTRSVFRDYLKFSPQLEQSILRLNLTAAHMRRVKEAINFYVKEAIKNCVTADDFGYVDINLTVFYKLPEEIAMRVLLACLMVIGNKIYKPRYKNFDNMFARVWSKNFQQAQTLHGCKIIKTTGDFISIRREENAISLEEMVIKPNKTIIWDNRFRCETNYRATICKNNKGLGLSKTLPVIKYDNGYINPFTDPNCNFKFIFAELVLDVLQ